MHIDIFRRHILILASGLALSAVSPWVAADPPSRVGRLGYLSGAVSFSPAGENDWVLASLNRPLGTGDRLWTDAEDNARAEIQIGGAAIRMDAGTSLSVLNLDDDITQVLLSQGSLHVRVRRLGPQQSFEVATPNLAFTLRQPGEYRIDVDPRNDATTIVVHQGRGEAWGEDAAYEIDAQQAWRFVGSDLQDYERIGVPRRNGFDRWAASRDHSFDNSRSARYVSADVVGYQDLDAHGNWRADAGYGYVWVPDRVAADWAPFSDGHWAWIDPWGWTWIDDAPWGFAVSHYGRWANLRGTWAWVPGPVRAHAYYAPALVAFVGGNNFQLTIATGMVGAIAWFPLAPREVYRPSYPVSRRYFENVNRSNTVINNTVIVNQYNTTRVTNVVYANRQVAGAVVAVPTTAFVQAQPVSRGRQRLSREALVGHPVQLVPAVVPTEQSVRGTTAKREPPPARVFERRAVARSAVPPAHPGLAVQREQLAEKPGRPLDPASRRQLKRNDPVPAPVVKVLAPREAVKKLQAPPAGDSPGRTMAPAPQPVTATPLPETQTQSQTRPGVGVRREPPATAPVATDPAPAPSRRAADVSPAARRDSDDSPRRGVAPTEPMASPPAGVPAEPAGRPERVPKPVREKIDQADRGSSTEPPSARRRDAESAADIQPPASKAKAAIPPAPKPEARTPTAVIGSRPDAAGRTEPGRGREPVARPDPPTAAAGALLPSGGGAGTVKPLPASREAAADNAGQVRDRGARDKEARDKDARERDAREKARERRSERRQDEPEQRAGQR